MNKLDFLKATKPEEFLMREQLLSVAKTGNPDKLPWWQGDTGQFRGKSHDGGSGETVYTFTISTPMVDRMEDIVEETGMDNKHFRKHSVVPWAHSDVLLPIGNSLAERVVKGSHIEADMVFDTDNDPTGLATAVKGKVDKQHLSATSIRFNPRVYDAITETVELSNGGEEEMWTGGFRFKEWELLEWSLVVIPANPEAVRRAFGAMTKEPQNDQDEELKRALHKLIPDIPQFRRDLTVLRGFMDQFQDDPKRAVRMQVAKAIEVERACATLRDLHSRIT